MELQRRTALKGGAAAVAGALTGGPFAGLLAPAGAAAPQAPHRRLRAIPDLRDGQVRLHLPEGFSYRSFHDTEFPVVLDDGTNLPGRHDGMGAFPGPDGNYPAGPQPRGHQLGHRDGVRPRHAVRRQGRRGHDHDRGDQVRRGRRRPTPASTGRCSTAAAAGCRGVRGSPARRPSTAPTSGPDFQGQPNTQLEQKHGYVFEVPAGGQSNRQPITRAGRFPHEAVSFDPVDGILYLTEDNFEFASGFYRYIPKNNPMETGYLDNEGRLQMLAITGQPNAHLEARQPHRATYGVRWVDIDDPDPIDGAGHDQRPGPREGRRPGTGPGCGAVLAAGGPGLRHQRRLLHLDPGRRRRRAGLGHPTTVPDDDDDNISGFGKGNGQVWAYHCRSQTLQVLYQAPVDDAEANLTFDFPDNITTSADGTLVVCEDSTVDNYIRGLSRGGQLWDIALNRLVSQISDQAGSSAAVRRRVRRLDLLPRRPHPVRQHPGQPRHDVRHLGALAADRRLTGGRVVC